MQLSKGMYGTQFNPATERPFGITCGQYRGGAKKVTHNSGWYNRAGEKLGFGDLDVKDMRRIAKELPDGELFIVLGEHDSFWNFVTELGMIGSMCRTSSDEAAPGIDYVLEKCMYVIKPGQVLKVTGSTCFYGFETVRREDLRESLKEYL